jgi:hypothetical protein
LAIGDTMADVYPPEGGEGPVAQGEASAKPWDHFASDVKNPAD